MKTIIEKLNERGFKSNFEAKRTINKQQAKLNISDKVNDNLNIEIETLKKELDLANNKCASFEQKYFLLQEEFNAFKSKHKQDTNKLNLIGNIIFKYFYL